MSSEINSSFYVKDGQIFRQGKDEALQKDLHAAYSKGLQAVAQNADYVKQAREQSSPRSVVILHDPLMGLYLYGALQHGMGNCGGCGGGRDGWFIILLLSLLFSAGVAGYKTAKQAQAAGKLRQQLSEVKQKIKEIPESLIINDIENNTKNIYQKLQPILQEKWINETSKSIFTAIVTAGLGILSIATCITIYAMHNHTNMPNLTTELAIAGGAAVGLGVVGHTVRMISHKALEKRRHALYDALAKALEDSQCPTPSQILREESEENAYLFVDQKVLIKEGEQLRLIDRLSTEFDNVKNRYTHVRIGQASL